MNRTETIRYLDSIKAFYHKSRNRSLKVNNNNIEALSQRECFILVGLIIFKDKVND